MKRILIPEADQTHRFYRANLHCHTVLSDGKKTPEEIKEGYKANGYSVVAYTDHDIFIRHPELCDDTFVALNGYEMEINESKAEAFPFIKTCHLCFVAKTPDIEKQVCYHREKYLFGNAPASRNLLCYDESLPDFERNYTPDCINEMIRRGKEGGFFVTYNHPTWSVETLEEYGRYEGMDAMEIVNYGCVCTGYDDQNGHAYDELLRQGKRLYATATDDNHNGHPDASVYSDSYGGYTMIWAPSLTYLHITEALEAGHFYSAIGTTHVKGPDILGLIYEDGTVTIKTSPAQSIRILFDCRVAGIRIAEDGASLEKASFSVYNGAKWFRLEVKDAQGHLAFTNAYYLSDMN